MSSKVLLLKYQPYLLKSTIHANSSRKDSETRTAIVLNKTAENYISIQGYPQIPCKEKHKCWSLLQQAVKHLLAVPSTISVCICFADTPHTPVSSLSTLLEQPSHLLDLTVSPLPSTSSNFTPAQAFEKQEFSFRDTRDPYCRYREMYRHSGSRHEPNGLVRQRCNFAEMNRLFSQLTEVSLSLQRTQDECERIAQKCGPRKTKSSTIRGDSTPPNTKSQSDCDRDSGKVTSPPFSSDTKTTSEETDSGSYHDAKLPLLQDSTDDQGVERLIGTAKSLVQHLDNQEGYGDKRVSSQTISNSTTLYSNHSNAQLPDCPSDVCARPSFTPGGAYVMWNPVSLDAHDNNNGQKIRGYRVFINGQLGADVEDSLASQVELEHMKHNTDYQVQVCTHGEHSNSILSQLLIYKHIEPQQLSSDKSQSAPSSTRTEQDSKTARVESWLKNGQLSVSATSHDSTDLPVHLIKEMCPTGCPTHSDPNTTTTLNNCPTRLYSHDMTQLGDTCDDTKSIGSSHTSGIVTDYPVSPKLHPACDCHNCSSKLDTFSCTQQHSDVMMTYHHGNDTLSMPSSHLRHLYQEEHALNSKSTSSTLCPSPLPSTLDTVIDEPVNLGESVQTDQLSAGHRGPRTAYNHVNAISAKSHRKGPTSPQQVRVVGNTHTSVTVTWSPIERDLKGCSNGCFVLGYRIYVNGTLLHSVDGAMTSKAIVKRPSNTNTNFCGQLMYYVTTRSMSGESLPSEAVAYDSMLLRPHTATISSRRSKKLDSVISSTVDSTSMCTKSESVASHLHSNSSATAVGVASHPMSKRYRMESYV